MRITLVPREALSDDLFGAWAAMHADNATLESPYFHPAFFRCVARTKDNVEVAIIEDAGGVAGFFPFERVGERLGEPASRAMSDYHGIVSHGDLAIDPTQLLRACRLEAWDFSHLPAAQSTFQTGVHATLESPQIDLAAGYDHFKQGLLREGSRLFEQLGSRERRLVREVGPLRYSTHETSPDSLEQILRWKSAQYATTGIPDLFKEPWTRALLHDIHATQTDDFAGVLSALYAGDQLVAAHFGMRARRVWHYWFPAYHADYQKFSPGLILLSKMAQSAASLGVEKIDLGAGGDHYKTRFMTHAVPLSAGSIAQTGWLSLRRDIARRIKNSLRDTPIEAPLRAMVNNMRARFRQGR